MLADAQKAVPPEAEPGGRQLPVPRAAVGAPGAPAASVPSFHVPPPVPRPSPRRLWSRGADFPLFPSALELAKALDSDPSAPRGLLRPTQHLVRITAFFQLLGRRGWKVWGL